MVIKSDDRVRRPLAGEHAPVKVFAINWAFLDSIVVNPDTVCIVWVRWFHRPDELAAPDALLVMVSQFDFRPVTSHHIRAGQPGVSNDSLPYDRQLGRGNYGCEPDLAVGNCSLKRAATAEHAGERKFAVQRGRCHSIDGEHQIVRQAGSGVGAGADIPAGDDGRRWIRGRFLIAKHFHFSSTSRILSFYFTRQNEEVVF